MISLIGQTKAFLDTAQQIKKMIENGNLQVGSRLPSERALAEQFKTSRATVREALRSLEIVGVIESRIGQGTFIKTVKFYNMDGLFAEIEKQTSPTEVFEARFAITLSDALGSPSRHTARFADNVGLPGPNGKINRKGNRRI